MATRYYIRYSKGAAKEEDRQGRACQHRESRPLCPTCVVHSKGVSLSVSVLVVSQAANESLPLTARWLCEHGYAI